MHVADAYDAMTSARAYRGARPSGDALRELWRCAGTEFHAEIVGALANALPGVTSETGDTGARACLGEETGETRKARREDRILCDLCGLRGFFVFVVGSRQSPAAAQEPARFSLESVIAVDEFAGENASNRPQIVIDVSLAVRMGDHWQLLRAAVVPPAASQLADRAGARWDKELYQAGVRYERRGADRRRASTWATSSRRSASGSTMSAPA